MWYQFIIRLLNQSDWSSHYLCRFLDKSEACISFVEPSILIRAICRGHSFLVTTGHGRSEDLNPHQLGLCWLLAQHSLLWCIEYWLHWLLQPFCCYQLRRLALCAFISLYCFKMRFRNKNSRWRLEMMNEVWRWGFEMRFQDKCLEMRTQDELRYRDMSWNTKMLFQDDFLTFWDQDSGWDIEVRS